MCTEEKTTNYIKIANVQAEARTRHKLAMKPKRRVWLDDPCPQ